MLPTHRVPGTPTGQGKEVQCIDVRLPRTGRKQVRGRDGGDGEARVQHMRIGCSTRGWYPSSGEMGKYTSPTSAGRVACGTPDHNDAQGRRQSRLPPRQPQHDTRFKREAGFDAMDWCGLEHLGWELEADRQLASDKAHHPTPFI